MGGVKGGMTLGIQNYNGLQRQPLFAWHGAGYIESLSEDNKFGLLMQLGYHVKGSAIRNRQFFNSVGDAFRLPVNRFEYRNISLLLGAKQKFELTERLKYYYMFGLRGEYTVSTNLDQYEDLGINFPGTLAIFPLNGFVNEWNYGVTIGGGFEFPFTDLIGGILEFSISPDFSNQYFQPELVNIYDPFTGNNRSISERRVRNVVFEVSLGFRFLRLVEYY